MISAFIEHTWLLYEPELEACDGLEATGFPKLMEGVLWAVVGFAGIKWLTILENFYWISISLIYSSASQFKIALWFSI